MIKNYLVVAIRNLYRNKLYAIINIAGLGVAMAICVVGYVNYEFSQSFDSFHERADRIYAVNNIRVEDGTASHSFFCPTPLAPSMAEALANVENFSRQALFFGTMRYGDNVFSEVMSFVDPGFLEIFTLELLAGDRRALYDPNTIVIAHNVAEKYFGENDPIGAQVTLSFGDMGRYDFMVGAVLAELPLNSCLNMWVGVPFDRQIDILGHDHLSWDDWTQAAFLQLSPETSLAQVQAHLRGYLARINQANEQQVNDLYLLPLREAAAHSWHASTALRKGLHPAAIITPLLTAFLILMLACFNFMSTSIAFASRRFKEIGIRKVVGGRRRQLVVQFLSENFLVCLLALVLGAALAELFVPAYASVWPELALTMDYSENLGLVGFLLGVLLFAGLVAGAYPALYLGGLRPVSVLKGTQRVGGTNPLVRVLLTLQLALSMSTVAAAVILIKNADYISSFDRGYDDSGVLVIPFVEAGDFRILKNEIKDHPDVLSVAGSRQLMGTFLNGAQVEIAGEEGFAYLFEVGENYIHTLGFELTDGRVLDANLAGDVGAAIMVNETMVRQNGWDSGVGEYLKVRRGDSTGEYQIVGVVRDFKPHGVDIRVRPTVLRLTPADRYSFISIKCNPATAESAASFVEATWKRLFPDRPYNKFWQDEIDDRNKRRNDAIKLVFVYIASIAVLISAMGLFALVSLNIARRTKEIGIRKVLGAGLVHIGVLIVREFVVLVLIGGVVASVTAYFLMDAMLSSIWTYYCDFGVSPYILSAMAILMAAAVTVGYRVISAARANPVDALRYE